MAFCHISNQIAKLANKPQFYSFGDYSQQDQEQIVSELADAVLNRNAALSWFEYPHTITSNFAIDTAMEDKQFLDELADAVINSQDARQLILSQQQYAAKGLIKNALDRCGIAPVGYDFQQLLENKAA